ncbi:MAG: hemolysin III family protein [Oscillospiraceae bacterium]|nr:hemolysin III family protein [Oscillospiraceae bacterium]
MKRTKLRDRLLPDYTRGEEIANMVTHIVGGALGIVVLLTCLWISIVKKDPWGIVSSSIYGGSMILLYTVSSVYHGLTAVSGKKVMQIIDHCTIYFLIGGTYTPILFCAIRPMFPVWAWVIFALVWGCAVMAAVFTAIDLKKYAVLSMICYIAMGWCIVLAAKPAMASIPLAGLWWLLAGGIAYTVGAVLYGLGKRTRYMHSVFHVFVLLGSIFQFISVAGYVL